MVDFLLSKLHCEREYFQLHRDTTVQSLLSTPSVENGRIVFHDSPLVRAAKNGQILVLDEADKAPVEVVALLKGLIEDGELALPDGTILHYDNRAKSNCIKIHPDFRIWALANPAVYPFHGNNLAREMADVFSCHNVPPMDVESHERILRSYGPSVPSDTRWCYQCYPAVLLVLPGEAAPASGNTPTCCRRRRRIAGRGLGTGGSDRYNT